MSAGVSKFVWTRNFNNQETYGLVGLLRSRQISGFSLINIFEFNVLDIGNTFILTVALIVSMGLHKHKHTHKYIYIYIYN